MRRLVLLLLVLTAATAPAMQKHGKGKGHDRDAANLFRPGDRAMIAEYYRAHPSDLPPGLAKRGGNLPPGLEKQLRRNGRLPPGLEKRLTPFPPAIESRLPPCPPEVRRGLIGGFAVMWSPGSGVVLDAVAVLE